MTMSSHRRGRRLPGGKMAPVGVGPDHDDAGHFVSWDSIEEKSQDAKKPSIRVSIQARKPDEATYSLCQVWRRLW